MRATVYLLAIVLTTQPYLAFAAACCGGAGPKSFIVLQDLQTYEIGLSLSYRNILGEYNVYGEPQQGDRNKTYVLSFGAGARLLSDIEVSAIVPLSIHEYSSGQNAVRNRDVGDILLGGKWIVLRSLFRDDWYPSVSVTSGLKAPTGSVDRFVQAKWMPGTGNGLWEPFVGLGFKKEYGIMTVMLDFTYTARLGSRSFSGTREGDKFETSENVIVPFGRRFSIGAGSTQSWIAASTRNGLSLDDTSGRVVSLQFNSTYFFTQLFSMGLAIDSGIPITGLGVNQPLAQTASVVTRYRFF